MSPQPPVEEFESWYVGQHPRVLAMVSALAPTFADARDITDEAFARALGRWPRVRAMDSPGGWVSRVAVNELRRRHRRQYRTEVLGNLPDAPGGVDPSMVEVIDLLRTLPRRERTVMAMRFLGDLSEADVAERLGITPSTVSSAVHSARQKLRHGSEPSVGRLERLPANTERGLP